MGNVVKPNIEKISLLNNEINKDLIANNIYTYNPGRRVYSPKFSNAESLKFKN